MMNKVLEERYQRLCTDWSDIYEHLPTFVKTVEELEAQTVIELGVRFGVSTIAWLYGLKGTGHLWSVDCSFPVTGDQPDCLLDPQGPLGIQRNWTFMLGYDTWSEILDSLPQENVDIVFIDTNHVYEETLVELDLYYPRVRPGGRILLHDTSIETTGNATTPQPLFPVRTAVKEFCEEKNLEWKNDDFCFGLGTIYVP